MLFDQEVLKCVVCGLPTLIDHGCEYDDDGFFCKWCDPNYFEGTQED